MFLELTPTKYTSEVDDLKYKGYRLNLKDVELGDTANKWTIPLKYRANGEANAGLALEVRTNLSEKVYTVRVVRKRSFLELLAFIFGFAAGGIVIARLVKSCLKDSEYFKAKDRECTMLFGAWDTGDTANKFSIDMAAAAHWNRLRASNEVNELGGVV